MPERYQITYNTCVQSTGCAMKIVLFQHMIVITMTFLLKDYKNPDYHQVMLNIEHLLVYVNKLKHDFDMSGPPLHG